MRKGLIGLVILVVSMALLSLAAPKAEAGPSETFDITVNIVHALSVHVDTNTVATYGSLPPATIGGAAVQTTGGITITNDGSGIAETYSLSLTNPSGSIWTANTAAGADTYVLNAAFDSGGTITWLAANHALSTSPEASTAAKFAGNQTGVGVGYGATRELWFQFTPPTSTVESGTSKVIPITITAG